MNSNEAFDQLKIKLHRIMQAYEDNDNPTNAGFLLYMWLDELLRSADKWEVER